MLLSSTRSPNKPESEIPPHRIRNPLPKDPQKRKNIRFAEIAGSKTAECAAILCCCPCGLANLLFLVTVRLPAGLFCRAIKIRQAKKKKNKPNLFGYSLRGSVKQEGRGESWPESSPAPEVLEIEKEMLSKLCTGFWRSLSQKDEL